MIIYIYIYILWEKDIICEKRVIKPEEAETVRMRHIKRGKLKVKFNSLVIVAN